MLVIFIPIVWLLIVALIVAACRSAARGDAAMDAQEAAMDAQERSERDYRPRRHSTCGTVRSRILTSAQSDQLAM
jgi:hypothetical protein